MQFTIYRDRWCRWHVAHCPICGHDDLVDENPFLPEPVYVTGCTCEAAK